MRFFWSDTELTHKLKRSIGLWKTAGEQNGAKMGFSASVAVRILTFYLLLKKINCGFNLGVDECGIESIAVEVTPIP